MKEFIEKLIGRLEEYPHGKYEDEYGKGFSAGINASIEEVNELAEEYINTSTDTSSGWIPCSERLPDVGVTVLCYWKKSSICENTTSYYYTLMHRNEDNIWISDFGICTGFAIAWMPLPAPYKEEGE